MKDKKKILIILGIIAIVAILVLIIILKINNDRKNNLDSVKFSKEYTTVSSDNVFVYRNKEEILSILKNGTGIVYFGFPECPWCQAYVKILNEVAMEEGLEKIYYYNILNDRKENTKFYQEVVEILQNILPYDEEGNKKIFVPEIIAVSGGTIIEHDNETSMIKEDITPDSYWTDDKLEKLQLKIKDMISSVMDSMCTDCNK